MTIGDRSLTRLPSLLKKFQVEAGVGNAGGLNGDSSKLLKKHSALNFLEAGDVFEPLVRDRRPASLHPLPADASSDNLEPISKTESSAPAVGATWLEKLKAAKAENEAARAFRWAAGQDQDADHDASEAQPEETAVEEETNRSPEETIDKERNEGMGEHGGRRGGWARRRSSAHSEENAPRRSRASSRASTRAVEALASKQLDKTVASVSESDPATTKRWQFVKVAVKFTAAAKQQPTAASLKAHTAEKGMTEFFKTQQRQQEEEMRSKSTEPISGTGKVKLKSAAERARRAAKRNPRRRRDREQHWEEVDLPKRVYEAPVPIPQRLRAGMVSSAMTDAQQKWLLDIVRDLRAQDDTQTPRTQHGMLQLRTALPGAAPTPRLPPVPSPAPEEQDAETEEGLRAMLAAATARAEVTSPDHLSKSMVPERILEWRKRFEQKKFATELFEKSEALKEEHHKEEALRVRRLIIAAGQARDEADAVSQSEQRTGWGLLRSDTDAHLGDHDASLSDSPGTKIYINACAAIGVVPNTRVKQLMGLHKTSLDINRMFLGRGIKALAEAITFGMGMKATPLKTLSIASNNINDELLAVLCHALVKCRDLRSLDLTGNLITQHGLRTLVDLTLCDQHLSLRSLNISKNNIESYGLAPLCDCLANNHAPSLRALDLSHNELSHDAGTALGAALVTNTTLTSLNLSWNSLRLQGAEAFARGLLRNSILLSLDIGWNGFGDMGPMGMLCEAIQRSQCGLVELNLCRNRIRSAGCMVLADALQQNSSIKRVILNGNQIGKVGAMAIVKLSIKDGASDEEDGGREISIEDCSVDHEEDQQQQSFDPVDPAGDYRLDMTLPHSRTVLRNLVRLVLEEKGNFTNVTRDGKAHTVAVSVEFVAPTEGLWAFSFASTRKPPETADNKTFTELRGALLDPTTPEVRRKVLLNMVMSGDAHLCFDQVRELVEILSRGKAASSEEEKAGDNAADAAHQQTCRECEHASAAASSRQREGAGSPGEAQDESKEEEVKVAADDTTKAASVLRLWQGGGGGAADAEDEQPTLVECEGCGELFCEAHLEAHTETGRCAVKTPPPDSTVADSPAADAKSAEEAEEGRNRVLEAWRNATDLSELFAALDTNQDGKIDVDELQVALKEVLGIWVAKDEAEDLMQLGDKNSDRALNMHELKQFLGISGQFGNVGQKKKKGAKADRGQERLDLVVNCFNRLVDPEHRGRDLLALLENDEERREAEVRLGLIGLSFTKNNPTGYYELHLHNPIEREIALRLRELKVQNEEVEDRLAEAAGGVGGPPRKGGPRDKLERVWRNCKFSTIKDGKPIPFTKELRIPKRGTMMLDFVHIVRPAEDEAAADEKVFGALVKQLRLVDMIQGDAGETAASRLKIVRAWSDKNLFCCQQVCELLAFFSQPQERIEVVITCYSRVVDWFNYSYVVARLGTLEVKQIYLRIGQPNLHYEVTATGYYELDLADIEQRFIAQEIVHYADAEPGLNCIDVQYQAMDFNIPAGWFSSLPRKGLLCLYYCRTKEVLQTVLEHGAYRPGTGAWKVTAWNLSNFSLSYLLPYCTDSEAVQHGCSPWGDGWVKQCKLRVLRNRLADRFQTPVNCFTQLDVDGSGRINRMELSTGLFKLGIWLHPTESQALMEVLDSDGGGDIEVAELEDFWQLYKLEGWVGY